VYACVSGGHRPSRSRSGPPPEKRNRDAVDSAALAKPWDGGEEEGERKTRSEVAAGGDKEATRDHRPGERKRRRRGRGGERRGSEGRRRRQRGTVVGGGSEAMFFFFLLFRSLLVQTQNIFNFTHHIKSLDAYIEH
jgi:hypothetical protein